MGDYKPSQKPEHITSIEELEQFAAGYQARIQELERFAQRADLNRQQRSELYQLVTRFFDIGVLLLAVPSSEQCRKAKLIEMDLERRGMGKPAP